MYTFFSAVVFADIIAPSNARQLLVVPVFGLQDSSALLYTYERSSANSPWKTVFKAIPVKLGAAGLGLGLGEKGFDDINEYPLKMEGDNRSPAGMFKLSTLFGYSKTNPNHKMPYIQVSKNLHCVDDSNSTFYNQIITQREGYNSHEIMQRKDGLYQWGVVIEHNSQNIPQRGSCIFMHITSGQPTAGCTAMEESDLLKIMKWLDKKKNPILMQYWSDR